MVRASCIGSFVSSNMKKMNTKQTIAVIGASGNMGSAISKRLSKGNYRLLRCSNEQDKVKILVNDIRNDTTTADVACFNMHAVDRGLSGISVMITRMSAEIRITLNIPVFII